jgi:hypothetical protein
MDDVKAIQTRYRGCKFRSRLEARYAVFFDALGIKWEYELEGYSLPSGAYLPDFWLPTFNGGMFAEVKPPNDPFDKARELSAATKKEVWMCEGTPDVRAYAVLRCWPDTGEVDSYPGIPNADQAEGEDRMFSFPGYENTDLSIDRGCWDMLGRTFLDAVQKARSARFEYFDKLETL